MEPLSKLKSSKKRSFRSRQKITCVWHFDVEWIHSGPTKKVISILVKRCFFYPRRLRLLMKGDILRFQSHKTRDELFLFYSL